MKRLLAAAAALSLCAAAALAQVTDPKTELPRFSVDEVYAILSEAGLSADIGTREDDTKLLRVTGEGGLVFFVEPKACTENGCLGLFMTAMFRREGGFPAAAINAYNARFVFMKAFETSAGDAVLTRYITADYGIPRGNVAVNAVVFARMAARFGAFIDGEAARPDAPSGGVADKLSAVGGEVASGKTQTGETADSPGAAHGFVLDETAPAEDMVNRM